VSSKKLEEITKIMIVKEPSVTQGGHVGPKPSDTPSMIQRPQVKPKEDNSNKDKTQLIDKK
jgi:hypothetical protein